MNAIQTEVVQPETALTIHEAPPPPSLFGTSDPLQVVQKAAAVADALKSVIKKQKLISVISGKEYPRCEAWTLLGTMLGVFPVLVWTRKLDDGWEARVEARTRDGAVVGAAEAQCLNTERNWGNRDDFALRSMAQTRATAKCLRMPLGFVMTLAGLEPTPAEEMASDTPQNAQKPTQERFKPQRQAQTAPEASKAKPAPFPTVEQRTKMIDQLNAAVGRPDRDLVIEYFRKAEALLPTESLEDLPLRYVPSTAGQMRALASAIAAFGNGEEAGLGFPPHNEVPPVSTTPKSEPKQAELPANPPVPEDDEAWRGRIVPIPRRGQKRDEYLKDPDTIGSLFDARHDDDEARSRLFGFYHNFTPKPWRGRDGKEHPPSQADKEFRDALDDFGAWFERNHPDEASHD